MSVTYESPTQCWSSEKEYSVISYSASSDNGSPSIKRHTMSEEFLNALKTRTHCLNPTTLQHPQKDILEPIYDHDLTRLIDTSTILLIDIRSLFHYSECHIKTAIHLSIPSILLKRPSFTLDKVLLSLSNPNDVQRFKSWPNSSQIVFYDHAAMDTGNFSTAILLAFKFKNSGYQGSINYLQGGFNQFRQLFPDQCHSTDQRQKPIDTTSFFLSNIRQNLELSHEPTRDFFSVRVPDDKRHRNGVIQPSSSPTHHPRYGLGGSSVDAQGNFELPVWLRKIMNKDSGPKLLAEGYEQLERLEQKRLSFIMNYHSTHKSTSFPLSIASSVEKGVLNRYNNIWPYEYSRVKLAGNKDDYINASYVQYAAMKNDAALWPTSPLSEIERELTESGLLSQASIEVMKDSDNVDKNRKYIATQGPLPSTFDDFWKMVWDEDSHVIVMLTNEEELDKIKCHRYWPTSPGATHNYGSITLTLLSEHAQPVTNINDKRKRTDEEHIIVREFHLKHRSSLLPDRTITHLQYTGWSDFGVPDHPSGLLQLIHIADEAYRLRHRGPITVHCSAGCGRTGTFCVVDTIIQRFWDECDVYTNSDIDKVHETISRFREQRISMVQSHRQYVFCYETILWWLLGYGNLPAKSVSPDSNCFLEKDELSDRDVNNIVHDFRDL